MPEHADNRGRSLVEVLEEQRIQALLELAVKIEFYQAQEQGHARQQREPCDMEAARLHCPEAQR